jgi:hypothetical protein
MPGCYSRVVVSAGDRSKNPQMRRFVKLAIIRRGAGRQPASTSAKVRLIASRCSPDLENKDMSSQFSSAWRSASADVLAGAAMRLCAGLGCALGALPAWADGPAFDRPGIAFATSSFSPGSFSIEQGLPDLSSDRSDGVRTTLYSADTVLRFGLPAHAELEIDTALLNRVETRGAGADDSASGVGDSGFALKFELPSASQRFSWALRGGVMFDSGAAAFTAGGTEYSLGSTAQWQLDDDSSAALYANLDRLHGRNAWTLSPALDFDLSENLGAFVELASTFAGHEPDDHVAGGGFTWTPMHNVQLDIYADFGLTQRSTDLQAGFGVSVFVD